MIYGSPFPGNLYRLLLYRDDSLK